MYPPGGPYQQPQYQQQYPQSPYPPGYAGYPQGPGGFEWAQEEGNLRTLSIIHYIYGALLGMGGLGALLYVIIGAAVASTGEAGAEVIGGLFAVFGLVILVLIWTKAALVLYAGYCLGARKHHTLCFVAAILSCLFIPFGTILGVITIVVLMKPPVKQMFGVA